MNLVSLGGGVPQSNRARNRRIILIIAIILLLCGLAVLLTNRTATYQSTAASPDTHASEQPAPAATEGSPDPSPAPSSSPFIAATNTAITGNIVQIEGGNYNTCLRTRGGDVYCWGQGAYGQLGTNTRFKGTPTKSLVSDALEVASGGRFGCIRDSKGDVYCWGETDSEQTGNAHTQECGDMKIDSVCRPVPTKVASLSNITSLTAGDNHACALQKGGTMVCWGENDENQLGTSGPNSRTPKQIAGLKGVTAISAGDEHTCALIGSPGSVTCWGRNKNSQSGASASPGQISGISDAVAISAGGEHTCAVRANKTVVCWGYNYLGQLGNGSTRPTRTGSPVTVTGLSNVEQLVSGRYHNCARTTDGSVYCWGLNRKGEIGDGTTEDRYRPTKVAGLSGVQYLAAGRWHYCVITSSNDIRCWGDNLGGQLGTGGVNKTANPRHIGVTGLPR